MFSGMAVFSFWSVSKPVLAAPYEMQTRVIPRAAVTTQRMRRDAMTQESGMVLAVSLAIFGRRMFSTPFL